MASDVPPANVYFAPIQNLLVLFVLIMPSTLKPDIRVALITGANKAIGYEVARQLVLLSPNFHIILGCRDEHLGCETALSIQNQPTKRQIGLVTSISIDVQSDTSIAAAVQRIERDFGRVDILINNAGTAAAGRRPGTSRRRQYADTFDVNVFGVAVVTEAFIPLLSQSAAPHVVFVSSCLGSPETIFDRKGIDTGVAVSSYRSSKTAVNTLTTYYSKRFSQKGWEINSCCPDSALTSLSNSRETEIIQEAAVNIVLLATLGAEGASGTN